MQVMFFSVAWLNCSVFMCLGDHLTQVYVRFLSWILASVPVNHVFLMFTEILWFSVRVSIDVWFSSESRSWFRMVIPDCVEIRNLFPLRANALDMASEILQEWHFCSAGLIMEKDYRRLEGTNKTKHRKVIKRATTCQITAQRQLGITYQYLMGLHQSVHEQPGTLNVCVCVC